MKVISPDPGDRYEYFTDSGTAGRIFVGNADDMRRKLSGQCYEPGSITEEDIKRDKVIRNSK